MSTPVRSDELVTGEHAARDHHVLLERMSTVGIVETVDGAEDTQSGMAWTAAELAVHAQCARGGIVDGDQHRDEHRDDHHVQQDHQVDDQPGEDQHADDRPRPGARDADRVRDGAGDDVAFVLVLRPAGHRWSLGRGRRRADPVIG